MTVGLGWLNDRAVHNRIAFYDLDRTVLATPTFTAFLIFAARKNAVWRLLLTPAWVLAMIAHLCRIFDRDTLKAIGISMLIGRRIDAATMRKLAADFADHRVPLDVQPGARFCIDRDRGEGFTTVLATAAPEFYADEIGIRLGFHAVLATRHKRDAQGAWLASIDGTNCYGPEKSRRVQRWMAENGIDASTATIRFYTDDISDLPTLEVADQGFAVNPDRTFARLARDRGWSIVDFRTASA